MGTENNIINYGIIGIIRTLTATQGQLNLLYKYILYLDKENNVVATGRKHLPVAHFPSAFLVLPKFDSYFYNSIETQYIFSMF